MITSCLRKLKRGEVLEVHADRLFDMLYIGDLCALVEETLDASCRLPQQMDAVYSDKVTLSHMARMVLADHATTCRHLPSASADDVKILEPEIFIDFNPYLVWKILYHC